MSTDALIAALRRRFGEDARVENVVVPTLGGSNRTIVFDLVEGAVRRRLVSREETYRAANSPFLSPADQFRLMQSVFAQGFPVPEPVFEYDAGDAMAPGYVCAFVEGETMPKAILHAPAFAQVRPTLAARCGELLAMLHAMTPPDLLANRPDSIDAVAAQRDRFDCYGGGRPAIELGLRWLERNRPVCARPVLVHGDFRVGNLMVTQDAISAVLDWECAHIGSPWEDLGWLCTRAWRFDRPGLAVGGLDTTAPLFAAYERVSGVRVDADAVRYWTVFGLVRWAVLNLMQASGHVSGERRGLVFAACGRNVNLIEYDLLMTLKGRYS
ncbi:MAG TPA: phosphotransferase family protein [Rhizomicrobium sp.]|nr:phosphotransferase family protein [Rhizomicrobium sp.]